MDEAQDYLAKAEESLAGAESELAHHRLNNCARSAYYAFFQAAIAALLIELCVSKKGDGPPIPLTLPSPPSGRG